MCFCTPSIRTPFCPNCNAAMFERIMELTTERDALRDALERIVRYYDLANSGSSLPSLAIQAKAEHENTMFGEARKALNHGR